MSTDTLSRINYAKGFRLSLSADAPKVHLTLPHSIPSLFTVKDHCNLTSNFRARRRCFIAPFAILCQSPINLFYR